MLLAFSGLRLKRRPRDLQSLHWDIHVPQTRISAIMAGERGITVDTGLRLDRFLDFPTGGGAGSSRTAIGVGRSGNSAHGSRGR